MNKLCSYINGYYLVIKKLPTDTCKNRMNFRDFKQKKPDTKKPHATILFLKKFNSRQNLFILRNQKVVAWKVRLTGKKHKETSWDIKIYHVLF